MLSIADRSRRPRRVASSQRVALPQYAIVALARESGDSGRRAPVVSRIGHRAGIRRGCLAGAGVGSVGTERFVAVFELEERI